MILYGNTIEPNAALKILTPWWDVMTRYLTAGIMTIALTTTALQAAKDNFVCSPAVDCTARSNFVTSIAPYREVCNKVHHRLTNDSTSRVITIMADYRQYSFLDTLCFQKSNLWYPTYFPFILVAEALVLLLIDNFWIMYPKTASALNHFVTLTMECYSSVGTHLEIFQILSKTNKRSNKSASPEEVPVEVPEEPSDQTQMIMQVKQPTTEAPPLSMGADHTELQLNVSDAMKVKTLYDKVEKFKENFGARHRLLIRVYRARAVLQILICIFLLAFNFSFYSSLNDVVKCTLTEVFVTQYEYFMCARFIAPYYRAITFIFGLAALVYLLTISYALIWSVINVSRHDVYKDVPLVDDRVQLEGDLAFLFSLLEQYNKLYCDRLAVFLSRGLKDRLIKKIDKRRGEVDSTKKPSVKTGAVLS